MDGLMKQHGLQKSRRLLDINYFVIFRDDSMKFDVERKRQNSQDNNCRMLVSPEFTKER